MSKKFKKELLSWVGKNNPIGFDVIYKKYYRDEEDLEAFLDRISGKDQELKRLIKEMKFFLGGRVNTNRGMEGNASLFNCYSSGFVLDSLIDILETNTKIGLTYQRQGGQGLSLSKLRPVGTPVGANGIGVSDGIIPFMQMYNRTTQSISQGNSRKGALLISLDIRHKEAEDFITIKSDLDQINKANLSLEIDDEFMSAVEAYYTSETKITLHEKRTYGDHIIEYDIVPIELFKKLVQNSFDYAEPACIFTERFRNYNLMQYVSGYNIETCNPCIAEGELIQTIEGLIPIEKLVGKTPYLYCMDENGKLTIDKAKKVFLTKSQTKVVKVYTPKGDLICTPDHQIMTTNRGWVKAKDLKKGDKIKGLNRAMASEKWLRVGLSGEGYEREHRFVLKHFQNIENLDVHHKDNNTFNNNLSNLEALTHSEHSKLTNTGRQIDYNRSPQTGQFLSKVNKKQKKCLNQGVKVGVNWFVQKVESLDELYDVYDIQMEHIHNFIAEGFVVHNCGEQPLPKDFCCNLGSINISKYVKNPFTDSAEIDYDELKKDIYIAVRALDDLIDENKDNHAIEAQKLNSLNYRNIGLGVMGYADALIKMKLTYGEEEALKETDKLFSFIFREAVFASNRLAKEKTPFFKYSDKIWRSDIIKNHFTLDEIAELEVHGLRNCSLISIAPTGSISMACNCSGGIEPNFAWEYTRKTEGMGEKIYSIKSGIVDEYFQQTEDSELPPYFISAEEIPWQNRVKTQAIIQNHVDTGISSTVNLGEKTTLDDVAHLYIEAWKQGVKGITIFNTAGKRRGILETSKTKNKEVKESFNLNEIIPITRKELGGRLEGATYIKKVACGKLYIIINRDENGNLVEVFIDSGKGGVCAANTECIGRLCSGMLRGGIAIESVIDSIKGIQCGACKQVKGSKSKQIDGNSCGDTIARTIEEEYLRTKPNAKKTQVINHIEEPAPQTKCPECNEAMTFTGGCSVCSNCGFSSCS